MRVLIDTNVLISAALSANGTPYLAYPESTHKRTPHYSFKVCALDGTALSNLNSRQPNSILAG